jgi:hypothetical protein
VLSPQEKDEKMSFDKIFEAYKEAILANVDKRDYDKVDILNTSMKLLSESINTKPVTQTTQVHPVITKDVNNESDFPSNAVSAEAMENFVIELLKQNGRIHSTDALNTFYQVHKHLFTSHDYVKNAKGDERWKNRFWNVTSNMRKTVLMPNKGRYVNVYALRNEQKVAQN